MLYRSWLEERKDKAARRMAKATGEDVFRAQGEFQAILVELELHDTLRAYNADVLAGRAKPKGE